MNTAEKDDLFQFLSRFFDDTPTHPEYMPLSNQAYRIMCDAANPRGKMLRVGRGLWAGDWRLRK